MIFDTPIKRKKPLKDPISDSFEEDDNIMGSYSEEDSLANSNDDFFQEDNNNFDNFGESYGGTAADKHPDLLKGLTNFDKFVKEQVNSWLGIVWDESEKDWVKNPYLTPIMNEKCALWCIEFLKIYTRENNIITYIRQDQYVDLIEDIIRVIWYNIGTRAEEFGITNNGDIFKICVELQAACELVLMGAGAGKYSELLSTVTNRSETISVNPNNRGMMMDNPMMMQSQQPKKRGLFHDLKYRLTGKV